MNNLKLIPVEYFIEYIDKHHSMAVHVVQRSGRPFLCDEPKPIRWAVICEGRSSCLSKKELAFIWETRPSERTDDFLQDTRFDSAEEALEFWKHSREKVISRYWRAE